MMPKIVYFSQTGQTKRFVQKIEKYEHIEITFANFEIEMKEAFILVMPSYEETIHPIVVDTATDFLETANNLTHCKGLFGGGNRNFAELFCVTAKTLAKEYQLPILHTFEFQGSDLDVKKMIEELQKIEAYN